MSDERCDPEYLPWFIAWDLNFLPDAEAMHELEDLGGDNYMILLASHNIQSNVLFKYDNEWGH